MFLKNTKTYENKVKIHFKKEKKLVNIQFHFHEKSELPVAIVYSQLIMKNQSYL